MKRLLILQVIILSASSVLAQNNILDTYVGVALESNLALQQKEYSYQKSLEALKESKRMFLPTVSLDARYSVAEGGRIVTIPFGDMMNPVYNNLNGINQSLNLPLPQYPEIENQTLSFVRSKEQETKIVAGMPVFNAAIIQNHKIAKGLTEVERISVDIYKRELVKEVKEAYVKYLQSEQMFRLYENTLDVVNQNLKNRQSLFEHDKITIDEVYAAKAQVKQMEKDLTEANKNIVMASAWFNFLLNRAFNAEIEVEQLPEPLIFTTELEELKTASVLNREEISQVNEFIEIQNNKVKLERGAALPKISIGVQYGFQGEEYAFNKDNDLAIASASLKWTLYNSGQRKAKVNQAIIDRQITENRKIELERQVQLEVIDAYYSMQTAIQGIELANQELLNFQKAYILVEKKYNLGIANFLEYSNSLNNKLNAENKIILAQYTQQLEQIRLERLVSAYQF